MTDNRYIEKPSMSEAEVRLRADAVKNGIDPDVAVQVARHEGGLGSMSLSAPKRQLTVGAYYWVLAAEFYRLPEDNPKSPPTRTREPSWQPARYTGISADTHAREEIRGDLIVVVAYQPRTWDLIGFRSDDGHHFVDVLEVGSMIVREDPETDDNLRRRLLATRAVSENHLLNVDAVTGIDLDTIAGFYGVERKL